MAKPVSHVIPPIKSFEDLHKEVLEDEKSKESQKVTLDQETLEVLWGQFSEKVPSPSTKTLLQQTKPILDGHIIQVQVSSQLAKSAIIQESDLLQNIRNYCMSDDIILNIEVVESSVDTVHVPKKPLSTMEKYQILVAKNPLIHQLAINLKLKPED